MPLVWALVKMQVLIHGSGEARAPVISRTSDKAEAAASLPARRALWVKYLYCHILFFILMNRKQVFFPGGYCAGVCQNPLCLNYPCSAHLLILHLLGPWTSAGAPA